MWDTASISSFLESITGDDLAALWRLAVTTGLRRGEVLGLRWRDVDLDRRTATVAQILKLVGGEPRFGPPKTEQSRRTIALDPVTSAALAAHRRKQIASRLAWGESYVDHDLVFCREDGSPIRPEWITRRFHQLSDAAGLPWITFHGLRHSHATHLIARGHSPRTVQERLGHHDVAVTLGMYAAVLPPMAQAAADDFAQAIDGATSRQL